MCACVVAITAIASRMCEYSYVNNEMKTMRLVILYNTSWYVFLLRRNLIASLLKAGHDVTVVAPEDAYSERVQQLGVRFIPITMSATSRSPVQEALTLMQIFTTLRRLRPDAVLSYTVKCNLYAGLCRARLGFRQIANVSGLGELFDGDSLFQRGVHRLFQVALSGADRIFFQNTDDRALLVSRNIVKPSRSRVIPGSGVDLERFTPGEKPLSKARAFLMFGRLLPKKGFGAFLEAARALKHSYGDAANFWILGTPDFERSESLELFREINDGHARGVVRYLQSTDDVLPYLREADAIVLPSTYNEGIPRSLLEALACGKPIVTTDWKGCRETVEHGKNGFLVRPHDSTSLTNALARLVEMPAEGLRELGVRSRQIAEERFDERVVINAYHEALSCMSTRSQRDKGGYVAPHLFNGASTETTASLQA